MANQQQQQQARKLSPLERASLFAQSTRQHLQMLPSKTVQEGETATFDFPKARLLSNIRLMVEATVNVKHATETTYTPHDFAPFTLLKNVSVDINNGFAPFNVDGKALYMHNLLRQNSDIFARQSAGRGRNVQGLVSSAGGTDNKIRFVADLPVSLNKRDAIGMILLQSDGSQVTLTVDAGKGSNVVKDMTGFTVLAKDIKITPMLETYTIPPRAEYMPDLSVIKLVNSQSESVVAGEKTVKLPVGTTYRKLAFYIEDANGVGLTDDQLRGNIELIFNQADTPIRITPSMLAAINQEQYGTILPNGLFVFDFTDQGLINYGGARDYIDSERLLEFWLAFESSVAGKVTVLYETLSQLRG